MYTTINETIDVVGIFAKNGFTPVRFRWRGKTYPVTQITLKSTAKNGGVRMRYYSVLSGQDVFRLTFLPDDERWRLEEIWTE